MAQTFQLKILSLKNGTSRLFAQRVAAQRVMDVLPTRRERDQVATGVPKMGPRTARTMKSQTRNLQMAARRAATVHKFTNKLYSLHTSICSLEFKCYSSL